MQKKLSIIILNYNTAELTKNCIESILKFPPNFSYEIIVVDNGSTEDWKSILKFKDLRIIESEKNLGFAGGNNLARGVAKGKYILFLNSDTQVYKNTLTETVGYLDEHEGVGALTCKIVLPSGKLDKDARRSFPTPWVSLTHFCGLDKIFPKSRIFAKYWYGYRSADETHEVDALEGAYFLTRKNVLDKVDWFSEDYFLDGEDIDLSWKIKRVGFLIIYYPKVSILHIKKASKRKRSLKSKMAGVNSMDIFYRKNLWSSYPLFMSLLVIFGIYVLKVIRFGKAIVGR